MENIKQTIYRFHKKSVEDDRYSSWIYCYNAFQNAFERPDKADNDYLALHLSNYLASWGMLRGSSKLINYSYKVHTKTVSVIQEYKQINNLDHFDKKDRGGAWKEINNLRNKIKSAYPNDVSMTATLVTKIMLGTLACTPAFDRFFRGGFKASFSEEGFSKVCDFALEYQSDLRDLQDKLIHKGHQSRPYPIMKLIDMYGFLKGLKADQQKKKRADQS